MFSSSRSTVADGQADSSSRTTAGMDLTSLNSNYYGGDFVEDGSFLVLNTDGLSLSPSTPPDSKSEDGDIERNLDIEVVNGEEDFGTPSTSITRSQVLGEDPESSVESSRSGTSVVKKETHDNLNASSNVLPPEGVLNSMTNMSTVSGSSGSTEANLIESGEEVSLLMAENKKLADLLTDSNEKMKQCITTTEKLKSDHEDYKKKHEESRELINQLRKDNELLRSQVSMIHSQNYDSDLSQEKDRELASKQESLERHNHTILELNERLKTVLTVNGQLNDQLLACQKENEEMRADLEVLRGDHEMQRSEKAEAERKIDVMAAEIDSGRQAIVKFKERHAKYEDDLACAKSRISSLEDVVEEKTKLTDSLRRNMEDTVTAWERCNQKLNQKEQEISLLTTKLAAIAAEHEGIERLRILEMQCQTYQTDFEKMKEERDKLALEKTALLLEIRALKQQVDERNAANMDNLQQQRQQGSGEPTPALARSASRNDNSAVNANESLPSPLTSLPTVAGQLVGFVRRELLGWEDQSGAGSSAEGASEASGASETVVQQPKQEAIPPCPICRKNFPTLEKLQRHAANCGIETDGEPFNDPFVFP